MKLAFFSRIALFSFVSSLALAATTANAAPISKCDAAKKKCVGKYAATVLGCHAKAEAKGVALDAGCIAKAAAKITGGGRGCFDKLDAKTPNDCAGTGDASLLLLHTDAVVRDVVTAVDPAYPAPTLSKCGAARKKCVGKKAAGLMGCSAAESKDGAGDPACAPKVTDKFGGAEGCDAKAVAKGTDCLGTATTPQLASLVDDWAVTAATLLQNAGSSCGNGVVEPGEVCDPAAPAHQWACGAAFACGPACNCACPTKAHLVADPTSASSRLDIGWTGLAHETPLATGGDVTLAVGCEYSSRPCGVCTVSGPIANEGTTEVRNQRCTNDTSVRCTDDTPCAADGGTCEFFLGAPAPLSTAGITICAVNQFHGPISGTLSLGSGAMHLSSMLTSRVYVGLSIDTPCAMCSGDGTLNDDVQGGTCSGGARDGLACDANATVPSRPDFGAASLDCPPSAPSLVAALPIDASSSTSTVTKTLSEDSPRCGSPGAGRCLCDTCNNSDAQPCSSNADCPASGGAAGICGGRRCLSGSNAGAPCVNNSACPGGGFCSRLGEPSRPSVCFDESGFTGPCVDADGDGEGECPGGPITTVCSAPHAQRVCTGNAACAPGTCQAEMRKCFPTGGFDQTPGTNTLVAYGQPDALVKDEASPILGSAFCVAPTGTPSVNNVLGLPGPGRATLETSLSVRP